MAGRFGGNTMAAKMKTAQQSFAEARLGLVDDVLKTAGWTGQDGGWLPPDTYREAIEKTHGRGTWHRHDAIMFMVRADEAALAAQPADDTIPENAPTPKP
jgi:hypothetical protein